MLFCNQKSTNGKLKNYIVGGGVFKRRTIQISCNKVVYFNINTLQTVYLFIYFENKTLYLSVFHHLYSLIIVNVFLTKIQMKKPRNHLYLSLRYLSLKRLIEILQNLQYCGLLSIVGNCWSLMPHRSCLVHDAWHQMTYKGIQKCDIQYTDM